MLVLGLRSSLRELQLGRKNEHRLKIILGPQNDTYRLVHIMSNPSQEARQSPFMLPSSLDGHATPSHENGDRAASNPPLCPPAPADTRDGAGLARGAVLWVHTRTQEHILKEEKSLSPTSHKRRQCPSGSSEMRGMYQPSTLRRDISISSKFMCTCAKMVKIPVQILFEDSALREPGGMKWLSPTSPQGTWGLKEMSPTSPQGTYGLYGLDSHQSVRYLRAEWTEPHQSTGHPKAERTVPGWGFGLIGAVIAAATVSDVIRVQLLP